jgi:hypothetical protein
VPNLPVATEPRQQAYTSLVSINTCSNKWQIWRPSRSMPLRGRHRQGQGDKPGLINTTSTSAPWSTAPSTFAELASDVGFAISSLADDARAIQHVSSRSPPPPQLPPSKPIRAI